MVFQDTCNDCKVINNSCGFQVTNPQTGTAMLTLPWLVAYLLHKGNVKLQLEDCENQNVMSFPFQFTDSLNSVREVHGPHSLNLSASHTTELQEAYENSLSWLWEFIFKTLFHPGGKS